MPLRPRRVRKPAKKKAMKKELFKRKSAEAKDAQHLPILEADANIAQIVDEELRRMRGGGKKHRPD